MSLVLNRRCTKMEEYTKSHELLNFCSNLKDIKLTEILGEGTFGIVYLGEAIYKSMKIPIAVKIIKSILSDKDFEKLDHEITFTYNMGTLGLGPKVYDAFYFINKQGGYKQVIIMDYYKYNGIEALEKADKTESIDIITKMINLIKKMVFTHGMYCVDIKPGNFVVNADLNEVKLIDFGSDWCFPQKLMTDNEKSLFQILIFQLYFLISNLELSLTKDELDAVYCRHFSNELPGILNSFYGNKKLTIKHYVEDLGFTKDKVTLMIQNLSTVCKRKSPIFTSPKRKSPSPKRKRVLSKSWILAPSKRKMTEKNNIKLNKAFGNRKRSRRSRRSRKRT